jgi:hypothetical protein
MMKRLVLLTFFAAVAIIAHGQYLSSSNLPIVIITTDNGASIPDEPKIGATMKILYVNDTTINYLSNQDDSLYLNYNGRIGIELRGSTSQNHNKKPYGFETRMADDVTNNNVSLMGLPAENDWVLNPMNDEPSYVRDNLSYILAGRLGHYAPRVKYCEVIVNGDYRGLYFLTEKIKIDAHRVDIAPMGSTDNAIPDLTGGYIFKADKLTGGDVPAWSTTAYDYWQNVAYIYHDPKPEAITPEQGAYIQAYFDTMQAVVAAHDQNVSHGFPAYVDIPSFVDYMIMGELSSNVDIYQKSTFFHKDRGGKLRAGPVWDFNLAYGYDFGSVGRSGYDVLQFANGDNTGSDFWHQLYEDNFYRCYLMHRWEELTAPGAPLHYDSVIRVMDSLTAQISTAVSRDRVRWFRIYDYNDHLNTMKTWLQNRYTWLNNEWDLYRDCIPIEPLPLVISMINYHPTSQMGFNADDLEFLCIVNNSDDTVDASGVYFRELGLSYTFPAGSLIPPHGEVFLASNAPALQQCYHKTAYGEFLRHLDNKSERLVLADAWGNIIDEVTYADTLPWPVNADGHGDFLILLDPDLDNALPESWISADNFVGVPNRELSATLTVSPNPTTGIVRIECPEPMVSLTLKDAQGRTLTHIPANSDTTLTLDLTPYPAGVYFVTAEVRNGAKITTTVIRHL